MDDDQDTMTPVKGNNNSGNNQAESEITKLFVGSDGKVNYTCPGCGRTKTLDVSKFLELDKEIRLKSKCPCGHQGRLLVERRKNFRKKTSFPGVYLYERKPDNTDIQTGSLFRRKAIEVVNLSNTGLRFKILGSHHLKIGDVGVAEFVLQDNNKSLIRQKVEVRNINKDEVGAQFCHIDPAVSDFRNINFYLFNE